MQVLLLGNSRLGKQFFQPNLVPKNEILKKIKIKIILIQQGRSEKGNTTIFLLPYCITKLKQIFYLNVFWNTVNAVFAFFSFRLVTTPRHNAWIVVAALFLCYTIKSIRTTIVLRKQGKDSCLFTWQGNILFKINIFIQMPRFCPSMSQIGKNQNIPGKCDSLTKI